MAEQAKNILYQRIQPIVGNTTTECTNSECHHKVKLFRSDKRKVEEPCAYNTSGSVLVIHHDDVSVDMQGRA
jgi:hypothetical protein